MAKCLAGGLMRFPQRLRERRVNEKAAEIFVEDIDRFQTEGKGPEGGGDACGLADQLMARTHAPPQQRDVRRKFRRAIPGTQSVENPRQAIAHISCRHQPQRVFFPARLLRHGRTP